MQSILVGDREVQPQARTLREMQSVVFDTLWLKRADLQRPLYWMYRDCLLSEDREAARQLKVRYDITILEPTRLSQELNKTKGHYHSERQRGLAYPELYEVLEGQAYILLQQRAGAAISDVILVEARAGDKVIVPPNYGHITINRGEKALKMANWVSVLVESFYGPYEEKGGGAYLVFAPERPDESPKFVANLKYGRLPELRLLNAVEVSELSLTRQTPSYELIKRPQHLRFLSYPEKFSELWAKLYAR